MKLVEIIGGALTDPAADDAPTILARRMTREPVRCTDFPGFLAGNIGRGFTLEAARIVEDGVAAFADVDSIMRDAVGFPWARFSSSTTTAPISCSAQWNRFMKASTRS